MEALSHADDEALHRRFWELAGELVAPLVELARTHTSPSIERSVLMRMGFSSVQAKAFVDRCAREGVLGRGAGAILIDRARREGIDHFEVRERLMRSADWKRELSSSPRP